MSKDKRTMKTTKMLTYDTKIQHQQIESERMHIMNHDVATVSLIAKRGPKPLHTQISTLS